MLLASEWVHECGRSMALQFAWSEYRTWKEELAAEELRKAEARAEFFRSYREQKEIHRWRALREQAGKLPVKAIEKRESERPIMGRKQNGTLFEFYRCRTPAERSDCLTCDYFPTLFLFLPPSLFE